MNSKTQLLQLIMSLAVKTQDILPSELWTKIFKFLKISDLYTVSHVCQRFQEIAIAILNESLKRPDSPLRKFVGSWIDRKALTDAMNLSAPPDLLMWSIDIHTLAIQKFFGISVQETENPIIDFLQLKEQASALTGFSDQLLGLRWRCARHTPKFGEMPCNVLPDHGYIVGTLARTFKAIVPQIATEGHLTFSCGIDLSLPEGDDLIPIEECSLSHPSMSRIEQWQGIIHCFAQLKLLLEDPLFDSLLFRDRGQKKLDLSLEVPIVFGQFLQEIRPCLPTLLRIDVYRELITDLFATLGKRFSVGDLTSNDLVSVRSYIPHELRANRDLILSAVRKSGPALGFSAFYEDEELFIKALAQNVKVLALTPPGFFYNRDEPFPGEHGERYTTALVQAIQRDEYLVFLCLPASIRSNYAILLAAARNPHRGGDALQHMPQEILQQHPDLVREALQSGSHGDFNDIPDSVRTPIIEHMAIEQRWANTFALWSPQRQQNRDEVLAYLKQNPRELAQVPEQYWTDSGILCTVFAANPDYLFHIAYENHPSHLPFTTAVKSRLDAPFIHSLVLFDWHCVSQLIALNYLDTEGAKIAVEASSGQALPLIVEAVRSNIYTRPERLDIRSLAPDAIREDANLLPWALIAHGIDDFDSAQQLVLFAIEQALSQGTTIHWFGQLPCILRKDPEILRAFQSYLETAAIKSDTLKL